MRKSLLLILVLLLTAVCACAAAETDYPLEAVSGRISFNENLYVVLTPSNLSEHPDLLTAIGKTADELKADWEDRHVMMQAWSKDQKTCVEVILTQDEDSAKYFDVELRTGAERKDYMKGLVARLKTQGYFISSSEIKLHKDSGHYVEIEYRYVGEGKDYRGLLRRVVRNGYTLSVDYQVFDRKPRGADKDRSRHIVNSVVIDKAASAPSVSGEQAPDSKGNADVPAGAADKLRVTSVLPVKTNDPVFTVEGTAYPGSEVIVVAMRWSGSSYQFPTVAGNNGKFSVKVTLPDEGLYQITVNMCINNIAVADAVLDSVTYSKTTLPYTLDAEIPAELTSDELVISGVTVKNVEIQCIVMRGTVTIPVKTIKTNGTGKFRFKVPTTEEGEYDITLIFSKKGLNTERINKKPVRKFSSADSNARSASKATKVSYANLVKKLDSYIGQTIGFDVHITDVKQVGEEWMITAAQKLNRGKYSNYLIYMAGEDPGLTPGVKVKVYGVCTGAYPIQSEEENTSYPGFDFLFFQ